MSKFPGVNRISGIPSLVIVGPEGEKLEHLDCDEGPALAKIRSKGISLLDDWEKHAWQ